MQAQAQERKEGLVATFDSLTHDEENTKNVPTK